MARYSRQNKIAEGGFGEVYECVRIEDNAPFVWKQIKPGLGQEEEKRFKREVRVQLFLSHRNIVPIVAHNVDGATPAFVMPRAVFSMRDYIKKSFGEDQLWLFDEIANGVSYAHENGVVHRDLKPENILLFQDEGKLYAAVSDFGLCRKIERDSPTVTRTNMSIGTIAYMAPEQWSDAKSVDHRADIYALGKILYEIISGTMPFPEMDVALVQRKYVFIIQKATAIDPMKRYQSVVDMMNDLFFIRKAPSISQSPLDAIRHEAQSVLKDQRFDPERLEKLARLLLENMDDNVVLTDLLPRLPAPIIEGLVRHHALTVLPVIKAYDEAVSGSLPFEYCDVVAAFYEKIFIFSEMGEFKEMVLRRLPVMAHKHNRFYAGKIFARLVAQVDDPSMVLVIKDVLNGDPEMNSWCKAYLDNVSLPPEVRLAIDGATG